MSIRTQQNNALLQTRDFLYALLDPKRTPKVPKAVRQRASRCLKHYPFFTETGEPIFSAR